MKRSSATGQAPGSTGQSRPAPAQPMAVPEVWCRGPNESCRRSRTGMGTVLLQVQDGQNLQRLTPGHPPLAAMPAPADARQSGAAHGDKGAVTAPGPVVRVGHHAHPGSVEDRKVVDAGRLPTMRVEPTVAAAGLVAVGGADRQDVEIGILWLANGQASRGEQQKSCFPLTGRWPPLPSEFPQAPIWQLIPVRAKGSKNVYTIGYVKMERILVTSVPMDSPRCIDCLVPHRSR